jgi:hypothetical protein
MNTIEWHALVASLPTSSGAARMRLWRKVRALGCGVLRDGVYLLPASGAARAHLRTLAQDVLGAGGSAHVLDLAGHNDDAQTAFRGLFDRTADYIQLMGEIAELREELPGLPEEDLRKRGKGLRDRLDALRRIDFFAGEPATATELAMQELEQFVRAALSADEPRGEVRALERLDRADYRGRTWATRRRPWIDRIASAWLIRRFIDPEARFLWLDRPASCPADAIGFDFDGATFTHANGRVTFEVLVQCFGLEEEPAMQRLCALVHYLDVGGIPVAEAAGIAGIAAGLRDSIADDDLLVAQMSIVFDGLFEGLRTESKRARRDAATRS